MPAERLLFSLTYYTPYISGLTFYVRNLAYLLKKNGYQITILAMQHDKNLKFRETIDGIRIVRAKTLLRISKGFLSTDYIKQSFIEVARHNTIIISLPQFEGIIPAIICKFFRKKLIVIYHCDVVLPRSGLNFFIQWILDFSNLLTLKLADAVVTNSEDFAINSQVLTRVIQKIDYVYPPIIKPILLDREKNLLIKKTGRNLIIFGFIGRIATDKGVEYLLEAIPLIKKQLNKDFKIILAGPPEPVGEVDYRYKIQKLARQYKNNLIFLGQLKDTQLGAFYSILDALVLPSVNSTDAFGMVQVEAMMTDVPVVVSDLPGIRIPVKKTGMGIIVPLANSQKLAEAIVEVLLNKKKYISKIELVRKEFDRQKTTDFFLRLIKS